MPGNPPGPVGTRGAPAIDDGTAARIRTPTPMPVGAVPSRRRAATAVSTPSPQTDPDIEKLNLRGEAKRAAYALKKAHPSVKFTSGRRSKEDQARAMASNVVKNHPKNRKWIERTYRPTKISRACQKWVDDNPEATTKEEVAAGLLSVMNAHSDGDVAQISKHLSGDAFDVQPVEKNAAAIKSTIRGLKGLDRFLDKEGGLVRWHAQF